MRHLGGLKTQKVSGFFPRTPAPGTDGSSSTGRRLPDFVKKCTVKADLQPLLPSLTPLRLYSHHPATSNDLASGRAYWRVDFSIKLFLAETCLKARMTWMDKVSPPPLDLVFY